MRGKKVTKYLAITSCAIILVGVGIFIGRGNAKENKITEAQPANKYPLLDSAVSNPSLHQEVINFDPLRQDIKKYLADLNVSYSFYFEYLPNGINIRAGDDIISRAASLMKTPLVMDLYKLAEQGKINLDSETTVQPVFIDEDKEYGNPSNLKVGDKVTLRKAAEMTLRDSDNTALNIIKDRIMPVVDKGSDSFHSLDLTYTIKDEGGLDEVSISSRSYSSILKCLYYSCFNTPEDSTTILEFLIDSADPNRLVSGVDASTKVAHKVGSSTADTQSDCGIIYYPKKPYIVCLMFFNIDKNDKVNSYFKRVSTMVHDYIKTTGTD